MRENLTCQIFCSSDKAVDGGDGSLQSNPIQSNGADGDFVAEDHVHCGMVTPSSDGCSHDSSSGMTKAEIERLLQKEANYDINDVQNVRKRSDYISWDEYFMATAALASHRSKDPDFPQGACIVDSQNRIIGIGYNGFPSGCSDDYLPWSKEEDGKDILHTSKPYEVTASVNAILNKGSADVRGGHLFCLDFPGSECAKMIVQAGIQEVVFHQDRSPESDSAKASRIILQLAGVKIRQISPGQNGMLLDFNKPNFSAKEPETTVAPSGKEGDADNLVLEKHRSVLLDEANYDPLKEGSKKREDYLGWDDYFMAMAFLTAKRSKDPRTQVGACLVDDNKRIIGLGYNGFPAGSSDDVLPWARTGENALHKKYLYVVHAEVNAVLNKCSNDVRGATLYVALFPCNECAKVLVQAGVKRVVYMDDKYHDGNECRASRILFKLAGVETVQHVPAMPFIDLSLNANDCC